MATGICDLLLESVAPIGEPSRGLDEKRLESVRQALRQLVLMGDEQRSVTEQWDELRAFAAFLIQNGLEASKADALRSFMRELFGELTLLLERRAAASAAAVDEKRTKSARLTARESVLSARHIDAASPENAISLRELMKSNGVHPPALARAASGHPAPASRR